MKNPAPLLLIAAVALSATRTEAVTFVNGSFENISASYTNITGEDRDDNTAADGWVIANASPDWMWGEGPEGRWNTPSGDYFTLGAATGTGFREGVKQTVSGFTVGATYELTFDHANGLFYSAGGGYEGVGVTGGWEVILNGGSIFLADSINFNGTAALEHTSDWFTRNVSFSAPTETIEFTFLAYLNAQEPPQFPTFQFLDNVGVAAVPEPAAALLGPAACLILPARRRR